MRLATVGVVVFAFYLFVLDALYGLITELLEVYPFLLVIIGIFGVAIGTLFR